MDAYNGVAGLDERALNLFISDFYSCSRKHVFHKVVPVASMGLAPLTGLEYDVGAAPRVGFVTAHPDSATGSPSSSFELWLDDVSVRLHYSGTAAPTVLSATVHATADLIAEAGGSVLAPRLTGATLDIAGEEKLSEVFNRIVSPHLDRFLQEKLLDPIRVPALRAGDLSLTGPTLATSDDRLLISAAMAPALASPAPLDGGWPTGVVFVAADFALVNALAAQQLPKIGTKSGDWKKTIKFGLGQTTIKASYSASVTELTLAPVPGQPTQIAGTATVTASLTAHAKNWFNVSGTDKAKATVTAQAVVNASNRLGVRLTGLQPFSLRFAIAGPAGGFAKYVETVSNVASGVLHDAISAALAGLPLLEVGTLPNFEIPIDGHVYVIHVQQPAIRTIEVAGRPLLAAQAVPDVREKPRAS